ncbi:hypothetical protein QZH41_006342 [Actinostola sp. cb2023]|nr:hypothetical protein QZH41_006342 [Actinostola sp. cb2023]
MMPYTLISHTNADAVRGRPTLKDVERFRNGSVHELNSKSSKVKTSSYEITNEPYMSPNYEKTDKTMTFDLTTNSSAETITSDVKKTKILRLDEQHFEDEGVNLWKYKRSRDSPLVTISKENPLVVSSFKTRHNGHYICLNDTTRVIYNVVSIQCQREICQGDKAIVECGGISQYQRNGFEELAWKNDKRTIIRADKLLRTTYVNTMYKGITLSQKIPGALVVPAKYLMGVQRYTCVLYDVDAGITPRRSTVTLKTMKCDNNITVQENVRVDFKCPYYGMLATHPKAAELVWRKDSRKIVTFLVHGHVSHWNDSSNGYSVNGQLLTIDSVTKRHKGTFTCSVLRDDGVVLAQHNVTLDVTQIGRNITQVDRNVTQVDRNVTQVGRNVTQVDRNVTQVVSGGNHESLLSPLALLFGLLIIYIFP